jgi:hypothetical protein
MASSGPFRKFRVMLLLFILVGVAGDAWLTKIRSTDWDEPLWVAVYPIRADQSTAVDHYIGKLQNSDFRPIEEFLARESKRYGVSISAPMVVRLGPRINERPPPPPEPGSQTLRIMWWSLKMRFWAWRIAAEYDGPPANISVFALYHDPHLHERLEHSLGLQKGLIGVVNAFADDGMTAENNVVIAHELLHTLGATDKYHRDTNQPIYPDGFAEPERVPRFPQKQAEIMAGRIPLSVSESRIPASLKHSVVGSKTAAEINWL